MKEARLGSVRFSSAGCRTGMDWMGLAEFDIQEFLLEKVK
jgi:hypothetical protein